GPKNMTVTLKKIVFNGIVNLSDGVTLDMVKIKAETFMMGSPSEEQGRENDEAQHRVTLTRDYWLGKLEVTQAQWQAVMGNNPSYFKGDSRPVEKVSWNEAKEFCNKLNTIYSGKLPDGYKFDLPTEAQWEYAARGGNMSRNYKYSGSNNIDEVAWYKNNSGSKTHEVGGKVPNELGLYDMSGNVWEWCSDWYGSYNGDAVDPVGPSSGSRRVCHGGGWSYNAISCRSAERSYSDPGNRFNHLGFRLALVRAD
ncbi:MAG: formylglycine-generating enzyme family protein, partial [Lentisphaeria bacterium]|nr:formylglycine-generating enzyme family protein [Lentisphaeria bacterium]